MIIIEYRIMPTIRQWQIPDYISGIQIDRYPMWEGKYYQRARKRFKSWITVRRQAKKKASPLIFPHKPIEVYFPRGTLISVPKAPYLRRFRSIPQVTFHDYSEGIIPRIEWDMLQLLPDFKGYFNHIFEMNDLGYFDELQERLEEGGISFKGIFLYDIIIYELFRRQLGFKDYTGLEKLSYFLGDHPLAGIVHDPYYFPTAEDVSYVLSKISENDILTFFYGLVQENIDIGVIDPRMLVWDGQFARTNCNNNYKDAKAKAAKTYNDPEAGYYRHNGVKKGVGYEASNLYAYCGSWERALPVYFEMVPGNRNENPVFRETISHFRQLSIGKGWMFVILDTGGYSKESLELCVSLKIFPLIRAKKGLVTHPTRELKKGYYFNTDYIPPGWTDADILKTYEIRPMIEAAQASNNTTYNNQRLNTRGKRMATISRALNYILDLLRALTAVKLGRFDLLTKVCAFSSTREHLVRRAWIKLAKQAGFDPLLDPGLNARQKVFWDKRRKQEAKRAKKQKNIKI